MKIIDLLNRIAKGEEVPKKIKINNIVYEYRGYMYCTEKANYQDIEDYLFGKWNFNILNDEVEIIEEVEDKEYEDIEELNLDTDELLKKVVITAQDYVIEDKINALIRNQKKILERLDK